MRCMQLDAVDGEGSSRHKLAYCTVLDYCTWYLGENKNSPFEITVPKSPVQDLKFWTLECRRWLICIECMLTMTAV